jgi:hypothetical protein
MIALYFISYHYSFKCRYNVIADYLKYFFPRLSIITSLSRYETVSRSCKLVKDGDKPYTPAKYILIGMISPA